VGTDALVKATFSEPIQASTIGWSVTGPGGAAVAGTATYDAAAMTASFTPSGALALGATYTATLNGAADPAGNVMPTLTWSFSTPGCPCGLFASDATPSTATVGAGGAYELGVRFRSSVDGYVTGVRFYKGSANTGTHQGRLWSASGQLLATAAFLGETATGWQSVVFAPAVAVTAGTTYVASYSAPNAGYAYDGAYFTTARTRGPLTALADGAGGGNGVYGYGTGTFPTNSYNAANYWVEPLFALTPPPDTTPPALADRFPAAGRTDAGTKSQMKAYFDEPIQEGSLTFTLRDAVGAAVPGTTYYVASLKMAEFYPNAPLTLGASYTATVSASDTAGNAMAPDSWSFAVAACPCSLWSGNPTPAVTTLSGGGPIELGLRFRANLAGYVQGVRFYKGPNNTGTHVGHLWDGGTLLASVTFVDETATGWQEARFATPVSIQADHTYTISYVAPNGGYAYDPAYFGLGWPDKPVTSGPLDATAEVSQTVSPGVYNATPANGLPPASTYNRSNYWVDLVFAAAP
jgi:hypothetical protein